MPRLKNRPKLTKEEYRERQREGQRALRQIKRANGICTRSGCDKRTVNYSCFACAKKDAARKRQYMTVLKDKAKAHDAAFNLLKDFAGKTLIERTMNARRYYGSVEAALI